MRVAALLLACMAGPAVATECRPDIAEFRWPDGQARFTVEVADDAAERARGLMHRESMATSKGMLFIYERTQPVTFWMENTIIPLDMIFIDETGRVVGVHDSAVPGDRTAIASPAPVRYVIEINGALAARIGIAAGAEFRHAALDPSRAVWPCR